MLLCLSSPHTHGAGVCTLATQWLSLGSPAGVSTVNDMGVFPLSEQASFANLDDVYRHAADEGRLRMRVLAMVPLTSWQAWGTLLLHRRTGAQARCKKCTRARH